MADLDVAQLARERQVTRATISMEKAAAIEKPVIFAVGNAPTALIELHKMITRDDISRSFISRSSGRLRKCGTGKRIDYGNRSTLYH